MKYAYVDHYNVYRDFIANRLDQLTNEGPSTGSGLTLSYDGRGNLTKSGSGAFSYVSENLLKTGPGGAALSYDPLVIPGTA